MKKLSTAIALICAVSTVEVYAQNQYSPTDPNIQYSGRWNFDTPNEPKVSWQGSTVKVKFNGTYLKADFSPGSNTEQYRVIIDGVAADDRIFVESGRQLHTLVDGLSPGEHTVELMRETFYHDTMTFFGLETDGDLLALPSKPELRIEFFGDSNMDGTSNYSEKDSGDSGTYYAYPAMLSRMLNAEMNLQAVGGATLDGPGDNTVSAFIYSEDYYNQDSTYRSGFDPDIIVVNAGANDVGTRETKIKDRYRNVVSSLRTVYGEQPHIVLMNAYGWDPAEPANYSADIVAEIGGNLSYLHFPWLWEQFHGSQWEHSGQVHLLAEHLESINPAWTAVNANDIIDGFGRDGDVANGSFEHVAPFGSFGWRYFEDGVERINDSATAPDGDWYIRLNQGEEVHQANDATGDFEPGATEGGESYTITAKVRSVGGSAQVKFSTHFQGQEIYTHDDDPSSFQESIISVNNEWQDYSHTSTAAAGAWAVYQYIQAHSGTIEVDDVRMVTEVDGDGGGVDPTLSASFGAINVRKRRVQINVNWDGATTNSVDVYRNDTLITTTANDGHHQDVIDGTNITGTFSYKVCNEGTSICSPVISTTL